MTLLILIILIRRQYFINLKTFPTEPAILPEAVPYYKYIPSFMGTDEIKSITSQVLD